MRQTLLTCVFIYIYTSEFSASCQILRMFWTLKIDFDGHETMSAHQVRSYAWSKFSSYWSSREYLVVFHTWLRVRSFLFLSDTQVPFHELQPKSCWIPCRNPKLTKRTTLLVLGCKLPVTQMLYNELGAKRERESESESAVLIMFVQYSILFWSAKRK